MILLDVLWSRKIACLLWLKFLSSQISIWRRKVLTFIVDDMSEDVAIGLEFSCAAVSSLHHDLGPAVDHDGISFVLARSVQLESWWVLGVLAHLWMQEALMAALSRQLPTANLI